MAGWWWRGWIAASKYELFSAAVLVTVSTGFVVIAVIYLVAYTAAAVGTLLGGFAGARYGRLDGRQIVESLGVRSTVARRWKDPTPARFFWGLLPVLVVCVVGILSIAEVVNLQAETDLVVGAVAFLGWLLAAESAARARAFTKFERASGRSIKAALTWTTHEYRVE